MLGANHPDTLATRNDLAWAIAWRGRNSEAENRQSHVAETVVLHAQRQPQGEANAKGRKAIPQGRRMPGLQIEGPVRQRPAHSDKGGSLPQIRIIALINDSR